MFLFVACVREDGAKVATAVERLRAGGYVVRLAAVPLQSPAGGSDSPTERLREDVRRCAWFLAFVSRAALRSSAFNELVLVAVQLGRPITVVQLESGLDLGRQLRLSTALGVELQELIPHLDRVLASERKEPTPAVERGVPRAAALADPGVDPGVEATPPTRSVTQKTDPVHFTVAGASTTMPGARFMVEIFAHLLAQQHQVTERIRATKNAEVLQEKGPLAVARGTALDIHLTLEDLIVEDPEDSLLWLGEVASASFPIRVPVDAKRGPRRGTATIYASGARIGKLHFLIAVGEALEQAKQLPSQEERHRTAFASYAHEDRDEVLHVIQGLQKASPELDVFLDVKSLRSGQNWQERLWREIPTRDVFYLFWSQAARASKWVKREWRCALRARGLMFIDPIPLVPPAEAPPPSELRDLHFDDWMLYFKNRSHRRTEQ